MELGAVQCGYCIPAMILSAKAYLDECPRPTEAQVREALSGNLCRCTGYQKIVDAVLCAPRERLAVDRAVASMTHGDDARASGSRSRASTRRAR